MVPSTLIKSQNAPQIFVAPLQKCKYTDGFSMIKLFFGVEEDQTLFTGNENKLKRGKNKTT